MKMKDNTGLKGRRTKHRSTLLTWPGEGVWRLRSARQEHWSTLLTRGMHFNIPLNRRDGAQITYVCEHTNIFMTNDLRLFVTTIDNNEWYVNKKHRSLHSDEEFHEDPLTTTGGSSRTCWGRGGASSLREWTYPTTKLCFIHGFGLLHLKIPICLFVCFFYF